jgi:hypothetical protein
MARNRDSCDQDFTGSRRVTVGDIGQSDELALPRRPCCGGVSVAPNIRSRHDGFDKFDRFA